METNLSKFYHEHDRITNAYAEKHEEENIPLTKLLGDDPNKNPDEAMGIIIDASDQVIWSNGLRRSIMDDLFGQCPGEEMRKQLLYEIMVISRATQEDINEIFGALERDREIMDEDEDEDE